MMLLVVALLGFDPGVTAQALADPAARRGAIDAVLKLDAPGLAAARAANLAEQVAVVVADAEAPFAERALATRALALLGGDAGVPTLSKQLGGTTPEGNALALESARALRQLGATGALGPALDHPNPEVRAMAAAAGAGAQRLCALLKDDPWPIVRAAAARGLAQHPAQGACLGPALSDVPRVATVAARSAGQTGSADLVEPLRKLAGDAKGPVDARAEALVALARLGDAGPARTVAATHLEKGGIEPLALAAVRALGAIEDGTAELGRLLDSELPTVRLLAAAALAERGHRASLPRIQALRGDLPVGQHPELDRILAHFGIAPADPDDPAADDPE